VIGAGSGPGGLVFPVMVAVTRSRSTIARARACTSSSLRVPSIAPLGEAADFVRSVSPERVVQIHEIMLSDIGQQSTATFLSPKMLTSAPLTIVPTGETITV
jgi:hypothetical protein